MTVRVRYAPSPTGHLHVGSLRTALYNWLFARHNKGVFLIRIEDTDVERSKPEYTVSILDALKWSSLEADETPLVQSERIEEHLKVIQQLLDEGKAYKCYCTPDELSKRLQDDDGHKKYDGHCYGTEKDLPYAVRFRVPDVEYVEFNDLIRGPIRFDRDQLDDFIIVRSDGTPMYNFVVVVDDAFMGITHVLRGEDHISNTPKQILLYQALGYTLPQFAHFSLILGPDGHRLSKRHMATSVGEFRKGGFLPDALCNYLARLGWSHGDQELFTRQELIKLFSLEGMNKSGAIFDQQKLEWMNGVYIRELSDEEIVAIIERDIDPTFKNCFTNWSSQTLEAFIGLYKDRVKTLRELVDDLCSLHERPRYESETKQLKTQSVIDYLTAVRDGLLSLDDHSPDAVDHLIRSICKEFDVKLKQIAVPLRVALTGKTSSPGIAKLIAFLSVEESVQRIERFLKELT